MASLKYLTRLSRIAAIMAFFTLGMTLCLESSFAKEVAEEVIHLDIRLMAADLIDELVYSWAKTPPLGDKVNVVLTDVDAPIGLDERFGYTVENRLFELIQMNAGISVDLVHCPACVNWVGKSTRQGTILGRGYTMPDSLSELVANVSALKGLSLVFEAEGRELVLRAQIYNLEAPQSILWARTFTTSMSARRLLRDGAPLISLEAAREEQRALLERRDPLEISTRVVIRNFNGRSDAPLSALPLPFAEQSFEGILLPDRKYRAAITLGFTSIQSSLSAFSVGGHLAGLIFTQKPRLALPDLYYFFGAHYVRMRGPGAAAFSGEQIDVNTFRSTSNEPKASLSTWRLGLELHMKHRFGVLAFLENIPILDNSKVVAQDYLLGLPYHCYGFGMVIRW